jgi:hypothetical protein
MKMTTADKEETAVRLQRSIGALCSKNIKQHNFIVKRIV